MHNEDAVTWWVKLKQTVHYKLSKPNIPSVFLLNLTETCWHKILQQRNVYSLILSKLGTFFEHYLMFQFEKNRKCLLNTL